MKRFVWRLQRLLDIKIKQEDAKRSELIAVTERTVAVRSQIMMKKAMLRQMLTDLAKKNAAERIEQQEFVLRFTQVSESEIKELIKNLAELEKIRRIKIREILKIRKFRKGLEKLRENARIEYMKEQQKFELKESDDRTSVTYARNILEHQFK